MPGRRTRVRVDPAAFAHNLRLATRLAGPERSVLAVLKADAYGHGATALAREAARGGAAGIGLATAGEARELREAGIDLPLLLLGEVAPREAAEVVRLGCSQAIYTVALAEALERAAAVAGRPVAVHVKVDTGMGRVGVAPEEALPFVARLREFPHLRLEGVMSHLAESEVPGSAVTEAQLARFRAVADAVETLAGRLPWRHVANSGLVMLGCGAGNLVRPGLMLYGASPNPGLPHAGELRPVLSFLTEVAFLKRVPAGTPLSYGGSCTTARESLIATLPVGYADGYRRAFSNRASVLVRGRRAPIVGRVCMDLCLADVTDVPGVRPGDEVVLLGRQGEQCVGVDELAALAETISYEVFCGVGRRVPRVQEQGALGYDAPMGEGGGRCC